MNKIVSASEFEANSAELLDIVEVSGQTVVVTRNGKPVVTLSPIEPRAASLFGSMKGTFVITDPDDQLLSALDPDEIMAWEKSLDAKAGRMLGATPSSVTS